MKLMIVIQKILILITFSIGFLFLFSESPINEGLSNQLWLTFGGAFIILLSFGWGWLTNFEEERFVGHETGKKTF